MKQMIKNILNKNDIYPTRWLDGLLAYSRYMGYIKPTLIDKDEKGYLAYRRLLSSGWKARYLSVPVAKRIVVLSPHPDDESIGAGGLLWAHRNVSEIHCVVITKGERGGSLGEACEDKTAFRSKMAEARKKEFSKTAAMLNARSCHYMDINEEGILCDALAADKLRSIIEKIAPSAVLLPHFLDDNPDHRDTNILYSMACKDIECMVLGYEAWTMLEPNAVLDISQHIDGKMALIRNYTTQLQTIDYAGYAESLARVRGFQYQASPKRNGFAEAYIALPNREYCELARSVIMKSIK